jgi:hypothetical protein
MTHISHLTGRPRVIGITTLIAVSLFAIALGQALARPHHAPAVPHHTVVTIQRAGATAVGQIARPTAPVHTGPLTTWHQAVGGGERREHGHGHRGDGG